MWPPATPSCIGKSLWHVHSSLSMAMTAPTNSKLLSECLLHRLLNFILLLLNPRLCLVLSTLVYYLERKTKILSILVMLKAPPPLFVANGRATPPTAVKMAPEIMSFL